MKFQDSKIYIAGSGGMVGSSLVRRLEDLNYREPIVRSSSDVDLRDQSAVEKLFQAEKPEIVIIAAAKVGGILANDRYRAEFIYDNLMIEANLIHAAYRHGVGKLILLGSSCIYPKMAVQPIKEEYLLTGPLESTNEPYAIAKIAGIKLCESYYRQYGCNFYSVMPTNLYGINDNFDLETSHVIPALIRKFVDAKRTGETSVTLWGTGTPRREFLYVDDLANAVIYLMEQTEAVDIYGQGITHINIGSGTDITIRELAATIAGIVGFDGDLDFDTSMADGTPRKLLDVSRLSSLGWEHKIDLKDGLERTVEWYMRTYGQNTSTGISQ